MKRSTFVDASFLHAENENVHANIGGVSVFEGPPPSHPEVLRRVAAKLHLVPRYRMKLRSLPADVGTPLWVDDTHFNLEYHVRRTALPVPGGEQQLRTLVARVMSQRLDRGKPLWEMWVVERLPKRRWAILWKIHHALVDGVSAGDLIGTLLEPTPGIEPGEPQPWDPEPEPTAAQVVAESVRGMLDPMQRWGALVESLRSPQDVIERGAETIRALRPLRRVLAPVRSPLNGPIGPHRRWMPVRVSLADVNAIRKAHGGTVNDVVLAAVTEGFRALLRARGEALDALTIRTLVPVSVRAADDKASFNKVAGLVVELPIGVDSPVSRLATVSKQMDGLKRRRSAVAAERLTRLADFAPPMLLTLGSRAAARMPSQSTLHTVTTNVPGPQHPLYFGDRRMLELMPYVMLAQGVRVGTPIFSYDGTLCFGVTGDHDTMPDLEVFCSGITTGIADLLAAQPTTSGSG